MRRIGGYPTYALALRARDEDVLEQLAARGGWYSRMEHRDRRTRAAGATDRPSPRDRAGVDPAAGRIPAAEDLYDAERWLAAIRA